MLCEDHGGEGLKQRNSQEHISGVREMNNVAWLRVNVVKKYFEDGANRIHQWVRNVKERKLE